MSSPYDYLDSFTLHDASFLLLDLDPLPVYLQLKDDESVKKYHAAGAMAEKLMASVKAGQLVAIKKDIGSDWYLAGPPEWEVKRSDLKKWAAKRKIKPKFLFLEKRALNNDSEQCKYTTPKIEVMKEAMKKFGERYNSDTPPKKLEVVDFLTSKGFSQRLAEAVDTMMRPEEAQQGGNKRRSINKKSN